ncbi:hypothetical protein CPB86DRAFT_129006 [Serendipita vermifera]|nr:hypothetical protein CPB86DRAFT_129006 [Serendipita vermifera]
MIEVKLPFEQGDSLRSGLLESRERVDTILCNSYAPYIKTSGPKGAEFMTFLDSLGPLPNLRRLGNLYTPFSVAFDVQRSIKQYANLEGIMNVPLTCQDLQVSKNKLKMETLVTTDDVESVLPIVENIHELRKVHFYPNYMRGRPENEGVEFSETKFSPDRPFYWTELSCDAFWGHFPISLLRRLPSLTQLQITVGSKTINTVASAIHHLQALQSVIITVNIDGSTIVPIAPSMPPNLNVRRLYVYIYHYGILGIHEASEREEETAKIELLTKSILLLMPSTEKLSIYIDTGYCSVPLFSLEELFYGTELTLNFAYEGVGSLEHVPIPPSTRRLFLTCDRDVACSLSSLYLKTLWIFDRYLRKVLQFRSINSKLDLNNWPALETLYINGDAVAWSKSSLTSLRTVNIRTNRKGDRGNIGITSFVKDLATRPESYPSLEEIELEECPELDILIIMLERRNLLQGPEIKKIKRISFQSPCSLSIQRVISTILGGKWADRPSNEDLSLAGNAEILLDLTLPGCYMCHRGLRFCDAPVEGSPKRDDMKDTMAALQVYPDDEDEILSSWSDRALLWENIDQNGAGRVMSCSWSKSTHENITADSF